MPIVGDVPDETLIQRYHTEGDEDAFAVLYWRYCRELLRFIHSRLGDRPESGPKDVLQQVFAQFFMVPSLHPDGTVRALLYAITRNMVGLYIQTVEAQCRGGIGRQRAYDAWCKRKLETTDSTEIEDEGHTWSRRTLEEIDPIKAGNEANQEQTRTLIRDLIDGLPPSEARAVQLVWLQGHTAAEAGKILDWPASLVRWRIRRAFDHMRQMLDAA